MGSPDNSKVHVSTLTKSVSNSSKTDNFKTRNLIARIRTYCQEYCEYTGIHGFKYFGEQRTLFEKICWIIIFISSLILCIGVIYQTYEKWQSSPIIVNFATEENYIYEIPFPAVTVCHEVKISKKHFNYSDNLIKIKNGEQLDPDVLEKLQYMSLLCTDGRKYHNKIPEVDIIDNNFYTFLEKGLVEFFNQCIWMGKEYPCYEIFQHFVTDEGLCMTFNMFNKEDINHEIVMQPPIKHQFDLYKPRNSNQYAVDHGYDKLAGVDAYPRRALLSGSYSSLIVNMYVNENDLDYACTSFQGFQVVLHKAVRYPIVQQHYFRVPLGKSVLVAISPIQMITSDKVKGYSIEKRQCLFQSEVNLKYFKHYTQYNCKLECLTDITLEKCNCVAYYMPKRNNTPICGNGKVNCMTEVRNALEMRGPSQEISGQKDMNNFGELKRCNCIPLCNSVEYNTEITEIDYDWHKEIEAVGDEVPPDWEKNLSSQLIIYFKSNHFIPYERNQLYGHLDFVANVGGLLGLFIGFSLLSFFEIIYFFSIRVICNLKLYKHWYGSEKK